MNEQTERQLKRTQNSQKGREQDLVDLPEQIPEPTWKQFVLTPKFILLFVIGVGLIGRNVYVQYTKPKAFSEQTEPSQENKEAQISAELYSRFWWYIILTVVFFIVFVLLKRSNDKAEQQRIREEVKKQEEEAERQKIIEQKANKIVIGMDQFGNVVDEEMFKKKQPKIESEENKKNK